MEHPEWLQRALERIKAQAPKRELIDTEEKAKQYGAHIGETVLIPVPPPLSFNPQDFLGEQAARNLIREGKIPHP